MLEARTNAEAHLYMDLHPCDCGETEFARDNQVVSEGEELVSVYTGACPRCSAQRRFEFAVPDVVRAPTRPLSYGGEEPSKIIGPGRFLGVADRAAAATPGSAAGLDPDEVRRARARLETAIAALREVLKFIPPGADAVPEAALSSDEGRELNRREPGRFRKRRLEAVLGAYTELLDQFPAG